MCCHAPHSALCHSCKLHLLLRFSLLHVLFPSSRRLPSSSCHTYGTRSISSSAPSLKKDVQSIHPGVTIQHFCKVFNLSRANAQSLSTEDWQAVWHAEFGSASPAEALSSARLNRLGNAQHQSAFRSTALRDPSAATVSQDDLNLAASAAQYNPPNADDAPEGLHLVDESAYDSHDEYGQVSPAFGGNLSAVPPAAFEDVAESGLLFRQGEELHSLGMRDGVELPDEPNEVGLDVIVRPASPTVAQMTPLEKELDAERRRLKAVFLEPAPIPSKPIHEWSSVILDIKQTANVTSGGMENATSALVLVGNHKGGIGYGVGKHSDAESAVTLALDRAVADAIHVSTYQGQLVHDLIGKKNNVLCILRSRPPAFDGNANWLLAKVMDFIGCKHYAGKITGAKHKNPYTVVQAIFDAFSYHASFEDEATKRGLRYVPMGEDNFNPRNSFPMPTSGPNYVGVKFRDRPNNST